MRLMVAMRKVVIAIVKASGIAMTRKSISKLSLSVCEAEARSSLGEVEDGQI